VNGAPKPWRAWHGAARETLVVATRRIAGMASTDEAPHHQAFIDEIRASGEEPIRLRHELRATTQHAIAASDATEPSAFPVALAGVLVAIGILAYLTAPTPRVARYGDSAIAALFTLAHLAGLVGLMVTLLSSPRVVRRAQLIGLALIPTLIGALGSSLYPGQRFEGVAAVASVLTRSADVPVIVGCVVLLVGCFGSTERARVFGIGWKLFAGGCLASAFSQIPWTIEFVAHDDLRWVIGSVFTGGGLVLLSVAMLRYVPIVRCDAPPQRNTVAQAWR
jgi:hypothetical protein